MTGSLIHLQLNITFQDDESFLDEARSRLQRYKDASNSTRQEDIELQRRLEMVISPEALPRNEKVAQTLSVFQKSFGLVVQDQPESLAALIASALNGALKTNFSISIAIEDKAESNIETGVFSLPPTRLLLRRLAEVLRVTIVVPSTRSSTKVYKPQEEPSLWIGILHIGNSFEEVSTYAPLICSNYPIRPPVTLPRRPESSFAIAKFRETKRPSQKCKYPLIKMPVAMKALQDER
jgi:hypothetical protein